MAEKNFHMSLQCDGDVCRIPTKQEKDKLYRDSLKQFVKFLENKIDQDLGFYFWKRYTAAAFWTQISTPINLVITLMTALTTAQSASNTILPEQAYKQLAIATLVITTLNTFFRPHVQLSYNTEQLSKWNEIGIEFENAYYSNRGLDTLINEQIEYKIELYKAIQEQINNQRKTEGVGAINFITDLIHLIALRSCIRKYKRWLDRDRNIQKKADLLEIQDMKIQNKMLNKKDNTKIHDCDFQIQMDQLTLVQKTQATQIQELGSILEFAKSPKCVVLEKRSRSNTPITPTTPPTTPPTTSPTTPPTTPSTTPPSPLLLSETTDVKK